MNAPHNDPQGGPAVIRLATIRHRWIAVVLGCLAATLGHAAGPQVYRWVDSHGVVHFGDHIPERDAGRAQQMLNAEGVVVGQESAAQTPAEIAAAQQRERAAEAQRVRDRNLLNTYSTVGDIERLRDQRLGMLADQIRVTSQYLDTLNAKLARLRTEAERFRPYASNPKAPPMPDQLADDLVRVTGDIHAQQQNLDEKHREAATMSTQFADDIARFKQLKGIH